MSHTGISVAGRGNHKDKGSEIGKRLVNVRDSSVPACQMAFRDVIAGSMRVGLLSFFLSFLFFSPY